MGKFTLANQWVHTSQAAAEQADRSGPMAYTIWLSLDKEEEAITALFHQTVGQLAERVQAIEDRVSMNISTES